MEPPRSVVQVVVGTDLAELAADALWQARPSAVLEVDLGDGTVRLTADVADPTRIDARWSPEVLVVDDDGYLDAWRSWAVPIRAGRRFVVHPAWVPRDGAAHSRGPGEGGAGGDDLVIVIDPGRAFGSGSHESTRLALALLEPLVRPGDRVLDVGCGSGVLSVAACLLGAAAVDGIDVEPAAVEATEANAAANAVGERVAASTRSLAEVDGTYDIVVANIGGGVLGRLAPDLERRVAPGGALVLSGVLEGQLDAVVASCGGCAEEERQLEGGWAGVRLRQVSRRG